MASASAGMKGFFKEKKKSGGISKAKPKPSKKTAKAKYSVSAAQPPALVSHGSLDLQDEYDEKEEVLRQFDMNIAYGPCLGMTRLERWNRARALGLAPPEEVGTLLRAEKVGPLCLWDGRV